MSERTRKKAAVAVLCLVVLAAALLWIYVGTPVSRLISDPESFREWVDSHGNYSRLAFMGMMVFQVIIAFIPGEPFEIAAGYAFGALEGTILAMIAAVVGSVLTFWLVRLFGMKLVRIFFSEEQIASVRFLKSTPKRDLLFLTVYMLPGSPKDLLGYFAGLTDIRFPTWLIICSLGRIPSLLSSTLGGAALGSRDYTMAILVFAVTLGISAIGLLVYNHISQKRRKK